MKNSRLILALALSFSTILSTAGSLLAITQVPESTAVNTTELRVAQAEGMTGVYTCDDGGTYYVRQVGRQVWWYGESGDGGSSWTNVFKGTISGRMVRGEWADVPRGSIRQNGIMVVQRTGTGTFKAINKTGNFGGSSWTIKP
jgi:hypothetical protein